jgi:hypothetical protein
VWGETDWATEKNVITTKIDAITTAINELSSTLTKDASNKKITA